MQEIIDLINEMSPYLLLGFLLAGLMHAFVPGTLYQRYLGGRSFRSVFNAALLGIPLPLCSCGVIPTAMSLYRQGASKGATVSFLIATPQTGVDSIIATYSLMGLPFALLRPLVALVTSLFGGWLVNFADRGEAISAPATESRKSDSAPARTFVQKLGAALRYAFVDMMQDIGRWLVMGLVIAGLITVFVPESFFALFADNSLLSILLVLACAVPMYLCATGSIPIAVALMMKGLSPGTALVLLMAGPAVNAASILVINKVMGRRTLIFYLLSIVSGAVGFGLGIDYLLPREWFTSHLEAMHSCCHDTPAYFNIACTVLLLLLLLNALIRRYAHKGSGCACHAHGHSSEGDACGCHTHSHASEGTACTDGVSSGATSCPDTQATETHYRIKGMSCNHCRTNVERAIAALPGVESVTVDLPSAQAIVRGSVSPEAVRRAVESIGFEVF